MAELPDYLRKYFMKPQTNLAPLPFTESDLSDRDEVERIAMNLLDELLDHRARRKAECRV